MSKVIKPEDALYTSEQIRNCERTAVAVYQLDELSLMSQAGTEAFFFLKNRYPKVRRLAVFCGKGNNGGDGYILARLAHEHGMSVIIYQCAAVKDLSPTAKIAAMEAIDAGVECQSAEEVIEGDVELIVDALLGLGIKGSPQGLIATAISQINSSGLPVLSLDLPSGLDADTGLVELGVKAEATLTFIALKPGLFTLDGPDYCGELTCRSLQLEHCLANLPSIASLLNDDSLPIPLPKRQKNSHKGLFGHVLVIGGGPGMAGAAALCARAALRTGAGMVTVASLPLHVNAILDFVPEAMVWGINTAKDLEPLLHKASFCVVGPGLGESPWATALFLAAIKSQLPMLIDASALNLLANHPQQDDNWILTPHPGEAARLLYSTARDIQNNRFKAANELQAQYGGVVVLKGVGSLLRTEEKTYVCPRGNPGLASAGMGDVLSGIIAGFAAQGLSLIESAKAGVWLHASIADKIAASRGEIGMLASDLIEHIPVILNDQ